MVGLAFELNAAHQKKEGQLNTKLEKHEQDIIDINSIDIFHYSFNYIGILMGNFDFLLVSNY